MVKIGGMSLKESLISIYVLIFYYLFSLKFKNVLYITFKSAFRLIRKYNFL